MFQPSDKHFLKKCLVAARGGLLCLFLCIGVAAGCGGGFDSSEDEQAKREEKAERSFNLIQECQNANSVEPDVVIKADIRRGKCFLMHVLIVKYDKNTGKCAFEGLLSDKLSKNIQDYSARTIFGYYTQDPQNIYKVKSCPDLDGVDIYDTVIIDGWYDNTIKVNRSTVGGNSNHIGTWREFSCSDQLPLFRITEIQLETKRTFADVGYEQAARLHTDLLSYC